MVRPEHAALCEAIGREVAADPLGAQSVWVFGSVARGTARPDSDVDVAILLGRPPEPTLEGIGMDLQARLESVAGRRVQIVVADSAPADLVHRVLRDGIVVLDRDPAARVRFEARRRSEWLDLEPVRRIYRHRPAPPPAKP